MSLFRSLGTFRLFFAEPKFTPMDATERLVLAQYARLGAKGKPQRGEWTVLAGIVLSRPDASASVVALGTGTKCLTSTAVAADGAGGCVHDGHAEVCARRALLLYAMDQLALLATPSADASIFVRDERDGARGRFRTRAGLEFHMWISQTPCGDASIYTLDNDGGEDAKSSPDAPPQKRQRAAAPEDAGAPAGAEGAAHHRTGARPAARAAMEAEAACGGSACAAGLARTKPGRGERTCCMSCSDKLARRRRTPNHTSHCHAVTSEPMGITDGHTAAGGTRSACKARSSRTSSPSLSGSPPSPSHRRAAWPRSLARS